MANAILFLLKAHIPRTTPGTNFLRRFYSEKEAVQALDERKKEGGLWRQIPDTSTAATYRSDEL
jgi:hypothetical protein